LLADSEGIVRAGRRGLARGAACVGIAFGLDSISALSQSGKGGFAGLDLVVRACGGRRDA
jgi:hypothetical protein